MCTLTSENLKHLSEIFSGLQCSGLRLSSPKHVLTHSEGTFLGCLIVSEVHKPHPTKTEAVLDYLKPKTDTSFLGLLSIYRRFIPTAAKTRASLSDFLKVSKRNMIGT